MKKRRAYVVRVWLDEDGRLQGQLSDPLSDWKRPFQDPVELWTLLQTFLDFTSPDAANESES